MVESIASAAEQGRRIAIAAGAHRLAAGIMFLLRKPFSELFEAKPN